VFITLLIVFTFILLLIISTYRRTTAEIKIEKGSNLKTIATELRDSRVIPASRVFTLYVRIIGGEKSIKAGTYRFEPFVSPISAAKMLVRGETVAERIVIPEGRTARQIGQILEISHIVSAESFLKAVNNPALAKSLDIPSSSCEGYLFPDTYFFEQNSNPEDIIIRMVNKFWAALSKIESESSYLLRSHQEIYQKVILASIVEREYRLPEDAPLIASVFENRLARNMRLQSCATVVYVLTEHQGKPHPSIVYYNDLMIRDDYNTYMHKGLPPGPISNPGAVSLKAALFPPRTEFLYFRLEDAQSGKHRFSRTLDEHNDIALIPKGL
jgi:UPF0755 protein